MTEDEAALKQCCGPAECGRQNDNPYPARWCVGSSCMAWRDYGFRGKDGNWFVPSREWKNSHSSKGTEAHGYCGLAGYPN